MAPYFRDAVAAAQDAWRRVVVPRGRAGHRRSRRSPRRWPTTTATARERGPANLIQGLRDFFGAHTYRRVDKEGTFHTRWSQDGTEVEA